MLSETELARKSLQHTRFDSYRLDSIEPVGPDSCLTNDISCDLLIVDGGFCGLWAAIQEKKQADRKVVLIEARPIGNGASGRPAAIMSTSVMHGIDNTERVFPDEVFELERLGRKNMEQFKATIERYSIDCDIEWSGELKVSVGDQGLDTIDKDYQLCCKYGHDAQKLDLSQVQAQIKSPIFYAGVWSKKLGGTVHPGKLIRALKQLAMRLGVDVFESTPHLQNRRVIHGIEVDTPSAVITTRKVLLATNAWTAGHPRIRSRVVAIRNGYYK